MQIGIGYSDTPDSAMAGRQAVAMAVQSTGRKEACDLILLFSTCRHDQNTLRDAVSRAAGRDIPIYGGGAVGIITNDYYGYAGDQAGVICLWLDGVSYHAVTDSGLTEGEDRVGFRLGQALASHGLEQDSSLLLLYDSLHRDEEGGTRMMMATRLLEGMKNALGFLPDINGAGLLGDHGGSTTSQYIGNDLGKNCAIALMFDDSVTIDSVIMHGCRPASPYYTVTKADGAVILEINNTPALDFMGNLLGSGVAPEQYPFFLLFGINGSENKDEYEEDSFASRLCLGIDPERRGIVMFESDMTEGTVFQLMYRSLELDYMKPKIESLFQNLDGREAIFALYIDCAGRCAGYGGIDMEDALVVQQTVAGRVPVFGIYTGVEIASIAGEPRGLDWTGVFCLFSQGGTGKTSQKKSQPKDIKPTKPQNDTTMSLEAALKLCEQNAAKIISLDAGSIALRYELELKRRGFRLLSELAVSLRNAEHYSEVFLQVAQRINATLNMDKTLVLVSDREGSFIPGILQGFPPGERNGLLGRPLHIPAELLGADPVVVNGGDSTQRFGELRAALGLPYFIAAPIALQGSATVLLITGRTKEQIPFHSRLGQNEGENVQAIAELMGAVLMRHQLNEVTHQAETDDLTGLWKRNVFQRMVSEHLEGGGEKIGAFMMIDIDYFKTVNDTHGHMTGDDVLIQCANAMRSVLRDSDFIGRQGGDEFVVFCRNIGNAEQAGKKAAQISDAWKSIIPDNSERPVTASIGVALAPIHGNTFQDLYANADTALYEAKDRGRSCYVIYDPNRKTPPSKSMA